MTSLCHIDRKAINIRLQKLTYALTVGLLALSATEKSQLSR